MHLRGVEKGALPAELVAHHQPAQQQRQRNARAPGGGAQVQHARGALLEQVRRVREPAGVKVRHDARRQPARAARAALPARAAQRAQRLGQHLLQPGAGPRRAPRLPGDQQVHDQIPGQHDEQRRREQVHPVRVGDAVDGQAQQQRRQRQAARQPAPAHGGLAQRGHSGVAAAGALDDGGGALQHHIPHAHTLHAALARRGHGAARGVLQLGRADQGAPAVHLLDGLGQQQAAQLGLGHAHENS